MIDDIRIYQLSLEQGLQECCRSSVVSSSLHLLGKNSMTRGRGTSLTLRLIERLQGCVNPTQGRAKTRSIASNNRRRRPKPNSSLTPPGPLPPLALLTSQQHTRRRRQAPGRQLKPRQNRSISKSSCWMMRSALARHRLSTASKVRTYGFADVAEYVAE